MARSEQAVAAVAEPAPRRHQVRHGGPAPVHRRQQPAHPPAGIAGAVVLEQQDVVAAGERLHARPRHQHGADALVRERGQDLEQGGGAGEGGAEQAAHQRIDGQEVARRAVLVDCEQPAGPAHRRSTLAAMLVAPEARALVKAALGAPGRVAKKAERSWSLIRARPRPGPAPRCLPPPPARASSPGGCVVAPGHHRLEQGALAMEGAPAMAVTPRRMPRPWKRPSRPRSMVVRRARGARNGRQARAGRSSRSRARRAPSPMKATRPWAARAARSRRCRRTQARWASSPGGAGGPGARRRSPRAGAPCRPGRGHRSTSRPSAGAPAGAAAGPAALPGARRRRRRR